MQVQCTVCGAAFRTLPSRLAVGKGKFCSRRCYAISGCGPKTAPLAERFWAKVTKTDGCWLWTAATSRFGYGKIGLNPGEHPNGHRFAAAHHVSWFLTYGVWPTRFVLHRCDVPACVNAESHLFEGSQTDNMRDAIEKGRLRFDTKGRFMPLSL